MEFARFNETLIKEGIDKDNVLSIWEQLSSHTKKRLDLDVLMIATRKFLNERKSAPKHDCIGTGTFVYCSGCLHHVCGSHGFGMGKYDYCALCTRQNYVYHFKACLEQLKFCPDVGFIGSRGKQRKEYYKKVYMD